MVLLLGAGSYIGQSFSAELRERGHDFIPLTRKAVDYTNFYVLFEYIRKTKPSLVINVAGFPGEPDVSACELSREETLCANTILPRTIAKVCSLTNTVWGHISSSSIYSGAKISSDPSPEKVLADGQLLDYWREIPELLQGFTELDEPNFSFRHPPCNFYSGTKALAEEAIRDLGQGYIWRAGIPFNEHDHPGNFLSSIQIQSSVRDCVNSFSHTGDFAKACLDLWERKAATGIYNVINPGALATRQIVQLVQQFLKSDGPLEFLRSDGEFYHDHLGILHSSCLMDVSKLQATGVKIRSVKDALEDALRQWQKTPVTPEWVTA